MRAVVRIGSVVVAVGLASGLGATGNAPPTARAGIGTGTAAAACPAGQDVTIHGIAGGHGCRPRYEIETAADATTAAEQDALRHAGETATDRLAAVAVDPASGAVIVGTGEGNTNSDSYLGTGVYRSETGTGGWVHAGGIPANVLITHIAIAGTSVYAGTSNGLYRSTNEAATFSHV